MLPGRAWTAWPHAKVTADGGIPVADGKGRCIWCVPCSIQQPLARAFELQAWTKHVSTKKHKAAARFRGALQPAPPQELEFGSAGWLAARMSQWREMRKVRVARSVTRRVAP